MRILSAVALGSVMASAGSAVALASVLFPVEPAPLAPPCTERAGTVYCANGYAGYRGPSGNLWMGRGRRGTVIVNMDDNRQDQEAPWRKQDRDSSTNHQEW